MAPELVYSEAEDGLPFLSIPTGEWSAVLVTPEADHPGRFGLILARKDGSISVVPMQDEAATIRIVTNWLAIYPHTN